jgi:outer membrane protein OmpA-like peptidoglycan-associated protein
MSSYQRLLKDTRQARVPLARIANQLRGADRGLKRKTATVAVLSLTALTAASAMLISTQPLAPFRDRINATTAKLLGPQHNAVAIAEQKSEPAQEIAPALRRVEEEPKPAAVPAAVAAAPVAPAPAKDQTSGPDTPADTANASTRLAVKPLPPGEVVFPNEPATTALADAAPVTSAPAAAPSTLLAAAAAFPSDAQVSSSPFRVAGAGLAPSSASSTLLDAIRQPDAPRLMDLNGGARPSVLGVKSAALAEVPCKVQIQAWAATNLIQFEKASSVVNPKQNAKLREFGRALEGCPDVVVDVGGHADKSGEQLGNLQLSWQRAESVIKTMKSLGFKTERLSPVGYSASRPLAKETTPEANAANRRVEFIVR